jgi:hypothetical protein
MQHNPGWEAVVKDAVLIIRITRELRAALEAAAEADGRTISGLVQKVLADHCAKAGTLKPTRKQKGKRVLNQMTMSN